MRQLPSRAVSGLFVSLALASLSVETARSSVLEFLPPVMYDLGNQAPASSALADFDHDGHLDVAVACAGSSEQFEGASIAVLIGDGIGGYNDGAQLAFGLPVVSLAVADFDQDGHADIAYVRSLGYPHILAEVFLARGDGTGEFLPEVQVSTGLGTGRIATADFNHDGHADLIHSGSLSVLLGNGDGTFVAPPPQPLGDNLDLAITDLDLDGNVDVLVTARYGSVGSYLGDGLGGFLGVDTATSGTGDFSQQWCGVGTGDVNGDLLPDVFCGKSFYFETYGAMSEGEGQLSPGAVILPSLGAFDVIVEDFDDDGLGDLALVYGASTQVLRGLGDGTFEPGVVLPSPCRGNSVIAVDADEDGRVDLLTFDRNNGDNGLAWLYLNRTASATGAPLVPGIAAPKFSAPSPNPFRSETELVLEITERTTVEVSVLDLAGRRVVGLYHGSLDRGRQSIHWNGRDARGARVGAGSYFVSAKASDWGVMRKVTVLR